MSEIIHRCNKYAFLAQKSVYNQSTDVWSSKVFLSEKILG